MPNILNPKFKYTHSTTTDIRATLKKAGHKSPCPKRQAAIKRQLNPF